MVNPECDGPPGDSLGHSKLDHSSVLSLVICAS